MEYYSATKKKKVLASQRKETWKNLKRILLSERDRYCVIPPTRHSGEGRSKARRKQTQRLPGAAGGRRKRWRSSARAILRAVKLFSVTLL